MDIFVDRINKLIKENKITKYKLAKDLNVSKQAVLFWCNGTNEPKICYLRQIASYFDVSADYLIGLEDETGAKYINSFNNTNINASNHGNIKF